MVTDLCLQRFDMPALIVSRHSVLQSLAIEFGMEPSKGEVTVLLERLAEGDRAAEEALMPRVYVQLHRLAIARMRSERAGHTLQATALVHEVYMRMCRSENIRFEDRAHFFRIAARQMRRILVDYARQHGTKKRNQGGKVPLDDAIAISAEQSCDALEIDRALEELNKIHPRPAQVVEMRFYGGLTEDEIAAVLGKNRKTVQRDWEMARAWLHDHLGRA